MTTALPAAPIDPPPDGDGVRLTLRHDGWQLDLFTLHTPHDFGWRALAGLLVWCTTTPAAVLAGLVLAEDPVAGLVWAMLGSLAVAQLVLLPLGAMLLLRVRTLELGRGRLRIAGMLGDGIRVPLDAVTGASADGEDLVLHHSERGTLRLPLRAGTPSLRAWLARSIDEAARAHREAPRDAVPVALLQMVGDRA